MAWRIIHRALRYIAMQWCIYAISKPQLSDSGELHKARKAKVVGNG